jgi:hypothetical protein
MDKNDPIELKSNEVQEILGGIPSRIIRFGIMSIMGVFILLILATFVIQYPDIINSRITVTTERPPAAIIARCSGKIERLFVEDKMKVTSSQVLGIIENPASYEDFLYLREQINQGYASFPEKFSVDTLGLRTDLQLGSIQDEYSTWVRKVNDLKVFNQQNYYSRLNQSLEEEKQMAGILYQRLANQRNTLEKEYKLAQSQFIRDSSLYVREVLPVKDYERSRGEMLNQKNRFEGALTRLAEIRMQIQVLDQRMIENQKNHADQQSAYILEINQALQNLTAAVDEWELTYVLSTPVDGIVSFNKFWSETQHVREGDRVMTILPENPGALVGKVALPVAGSGKIKTEMDVNIKFDNYPYMEYGMVKGKVKNISLVPEDNFYMAEVTFPHGLVTTYGNELELQNEIVGKAEIVTGELRVIQRIFNPLKALWQERIVRKN